MPLFYLALAFLLGVILASLAALPAVAWFAVAITSLLLAALVHFLHRRPPRHKRFPSLPSSLFPFLPILLLTALTLGAARYQSTRPVLSDPAFIAAYNDTGETVTIIGVLAEPPDERDAYTNLRIRAEQIHPQNGIQHIPVSGLILARVDPGGEWRYGDRVALTGQLETPPEDEEFSYRDYLARQGVYAYASRANVALLESGHGSPVWRAIFSLKARALETVYQLFPDPEASLLVGILLGIETGISPDLKDAFRDTGTAHIVAISGFNITIVAAIFTKYFSRAFGRRLGVVAAIVTIGLYTILVGANAAVVRAALMGTLAILARQARRPQAALNTLTVTAAVMAYLNPLVLWDAGFQLSFFATLGLLLYAEPLTNAFTRLTARYLPLSIVQKIARPVGEFFLLTLAAQIATLPIIIYHFQRLSLISILANPLVLPVQPAIMILGGIAVIIGLFTLPLGKLIALPVWVFVVYTIRVVEWIAKIPNGVTALGQITPPIVILLYLALFGLTFAGRANRLRSSIHTLASPVALVLLTLLAALAWRAALAAPDSRLHLTLLDVGAGDAILIQTPTGRHILIDGGPSTIQLSDALGRRIPPGQRQLDFLIVAAPFDEQLDALPRVVERFPPASVLWAGPPNVSRSARQLGETLTEAQLPIISAEPGHTLDLGRGATLRVLTTGKRGAVLLLEWKSFRALLPIGADLGTLEMLQMGKTIAPISVLLLAESGFTPLNPPEWITNLHPQLTLISVDAGNHGGLPSPETLDALEGYTLLRTDQNGWISITTDGETIWVEVEKK